MVDKLPNHPSHPKGRNPYAHVALKVKNKFGSSYKDLPDEFLEIFIVDNEFKPIGTVPSSKVLRNSRDTKMITITNESQLSKPVNLDREEVGHIFENYNLNSACVVDKNNKLVS